MSPSAPLPGTAPGRMMSRLPSSFPGAEALQDGGGATPTPPGLPPLGRYNSVLNDGLFNSLQVRPTLPARLVPHCHAYVRGSKGEVSELHACDDMFNICPVLHMALHPAPCEAFAKPLSAFCSVWAWNLCCSISNADVLQLAVRTSIEL